MNLNISHRKRLNAKADFVCEAKTYRKRHTYGSGNLFKKYIEVFVFCCCLVYSSAFFLLWLFAELCGAHFVVAFHCYCCRCLVLVFISYLLCRHLWNFNLHFCCCFALSLCRSLTRTRQLNGREREREREPESASSSHRYFYRMRERQTWVGERDECEWVAYCAFPRCTWFVVAAKVALFAFVFLLFHYLSVSISFGFRTFPSPSIAIPCVSRICQIFAPCICFFFFWRRCGLYCCLILVRNTCIANFILLHCGQ